MQGASPPIASSIARPASPSSYSAYLVFTRTPAVGVAVLASCGGFTRVKPLAEALFDRVLAGS